MSPSFESALAPTFKRVVETPQEVAPVLGYLMTPIALGAYVLGCWRLGADMGWMGEFFISRGLFSHWQVWLALGIGIQAWPPTWCGSAAMTARCSPETMIQTARFQMSL
jgi:hypothetical protein